MKLGLVLLALTSPAAAQPNGQQVFAQTCAVCHYDPGKADVQPRIGPSLKGVIGRRAGTAPGFTRYSPAMIRYAATWDRQTLSTYLAAPRKVVPGTTMAFAGIADPARRAALIDYLARSR